jgi:hypothetical protein
MSPKTPATFRIDDDLLAALQQIKEKRGLSVAEQVQRALVVWAKTNGIRLTQKDGAIMREQEQEVVEVLNGTGVLRYQSGEEVGPRDYDLAVWQTFHIARSMGGPVERIPGLKDIRGTIDCSEGELFNFVAKGAMLELELTDGRRLPFFFSDSNGQIAPSGQMK